MTLIPSLPGFYAELALSVDAFCRQCTSLFHPAGEGSPKIACHPGSALYELGQKLADKWTELTRRIDGLAETGPEPYRERLQELFKEFRKCAVVLRVAVNRTQFLAHQLTAVVERLRLESGQAELKSMDALDDKGAKEKVDEAVTFVESLLEFVRRIFERDIPMDLMPIRERMRMRTIMLNSCGGIIELLKGIGHFPTQMQEMKGQMAIVNREMVELFRQGAMPFLGADEGQPIG
jgi:hypothetical protein